MLRLSWKPVSGVSEVVHGVSRARPVVQALRGACTPRAQASVQDPSRTPSLASAVRSGFARGSLTLATGYPDGCPGGVR